MSLVNRACKKAGIKLSRDVPVRTIKGKNGDKDRVVADCRARTIAKMIGMLRNLESDFEDMASDKARLADEKAVLIQSLAEKQETLINERIECSTITDEDRDYILNGPKSRAQALPAATG